MKRIILTLIAFLSIASSSTLVLQPSLAFADAKGDICAGIAGNSGQGCDTSTAPIDNTLQNVVNLLSAIAGVIAVIMLVVAGFKYTTAAGDSSKISSARTTITYAIVGIIIVGAAQLLVRLVLNKTLNL